MSSSLYCGPVQVVVHANARVVEVAPRLRAESVFLPKSKSSLSYGRCRALSATTSFIRTRGLPWPRWKNIRSNGAPSARQIARSGRKRMSR